MTSTTPDSSRFNGPPSVSEIYLAIVDLRGQVNSFINVQLYREESHRVEIARLREEMAQRERDHEERLRILEQRRYVEPKSVWAALGFAVAVLGTVTTVINILLSAVMK